LGAELAFSATPVAWFKASSIGLTNGATVASWPDLTGNGYDATQGTSSQQPTFATNAMNGRPAVRFNNGNHSSLGFNRPAQDDFTIVCVFQSTQGLNSGTLYYQGAGLVNGEVGGVVNDFGTCLFANGAICAGTGKPDVAVNSTAGYNDGKPHVFAFERVRTTGLVSLYVDGWLAGNTTGSTASLTAPSRLVLGAQQTSLYYLSGDIAEVQVFTNALAASDLLTVERGLFEDYGLVPLTPTGLAIQVRNGQFSLSWNASAGATAYNVKRSLTQTGPYTTIATTAALTYTDTNAALTSTWFYAISATNANGESSNSIGLGTANIQAVPAFVWFKADAITGLTNGAAVASWPDSTGNGYDASQAGAGRQPTWITNAMNGKPVVRFNSANSTSLALSRPIKDDFTIVCVFQSAQGLNSGTYFYQGAGLVNGEVGGVDNDLGTCLFADGSISAGTGNPDVAVVSSTGYNDGKPHIMTFERVRATGQVSLYVDGSFGGATMGGTNSLTAPSQLVLGAQQTALYYFTGDIAETQIFTNALSDPDRVTVETGLFQKYRLPPSTPSGLYLQIQNGQPVLSWLAISGATSYYVERATSLGGPFDLVATNLTATFVDISVSATNVYYYRIIALNGNGQSPASVVVGTDAILNPHDLPGPSSRTTPIVISEIMWKPAPRTDGKNLEYIELYNSNPWSQDIGGYQLSCADMTYTFGAGTLIGSNSFLVVAAAPADIESVYGITNVVGPYTGSLKKSETLQLLDEQGSVLLTVPYSNIRPWPAATDGTGHSLVLSNPSYGEGDARAWDLSDVTGGSPGQAEVFHPDPRRNVVINELLAHSENPAVPQFIELYNHSTATVELSGCILTDDPATNRFVIPSGTVIGPAGFMVFTEPQLGFALNGAGGTLYLIKPDGSRVLDAVSFGGQADGVTFGRWPDGANDFYALSANTPGTNNAAILIGDVVINELMYDPIGGNDDDQYIELYNQGTNSVNLAGWQLTSGVTFTFPSVALVPKGYLVVARNRTNLLANHPTLNSANVVGNFSGKLSHNGELLTLVQPKTLYGTNTIYVEADEVTYGTGGRWGEWSAGGGSSLELIDPRANHRLAANWADSDESQKSSWTNITCTGLLDNGVNYGSSIGYAQIGLLDVGEALVDNLSVTSSNGPNLVINPDFESGALTSWSLQGDHARSSLENSGYGGSYSLHLRTGDRMYNGDNSCQMTLAGNSLAAGQSATLSFATRWLHGWPEVLLRLNGGWLEATSLLPVPGNLGSPGAANSRMVTNAGPAIYNVTHFPTVPMANQLLLVTAQASDPDGVQSLVLYYRLDPATNYTAVPLRDDGTNGDVVPGDGVYSATIPGQPAGQLVAFYIAATDNLNAVTRFPALRPQDNEPARECLAVFGDGNPGGSFGVYHLWLTRSNVTRWANLGNLSNEGIDCTMVSGNRVIYNMQARYAGSPVHQTFDTPNGSWCSYKFMFNDDDKFLGATSFNKIHWPGNTANDPTIQREQLANTFLRALGVPWLNRRYMVLYVNGNRRGTLMEDAQTPNSDMVKQYFPNDTDGWLYKVARWFEFAPFLSGYSLPNKLAAEAMLMPYTTGGAKKPARYRWTFENRRTPDSASNYTNLFSLIDAASAQGTANYASNLNNLADMENWMRVFAANHAAGNWDAFGCSSGQNLYAYVGALSTKWTLMMFDFNLGLGTEYNYPPGQNLFTTLGGDANIAGIYNEPAFRRMYWRALQELCVVGPLNLANSVPMLNAKYRVFGSNGISVEDPNLNLIPWLSQASTSIQAQVNAANAPAFSTNSTLVLSNGIAVIRGQAPFNVVSVLVNGVAYPLAWTGVTSWSLNVPLQHGTNLLNLTCADIHGDPIAGDSITMSVINTNSSAVTSSSFINYSTPGMIYSQSFDSLPNAGDTSVNAANPATIGGVTYSLANPFDFAFPQSTTGEGGLGLGLLRGWYGYAALGSKFGATPGDQTTGGTLSFGLPNSTNRALGLLATSSTGGTAFGVKIVNGTGSTLNYLKLRFIGELWRQSDTPKTLQVYYSIDPTSATVWPATPTGYLPALNVSFPTVAADKGGVAVDGTASVNQTNVAILNEPIAPWPPGAALWLVWQMTDSAGKAQGLAIDNFSFSATQQPVTSLGAIAITLSQTNATLSWPTVAAGVYRVQCKNDLTDDRWTSLGPDLTGSGVPLVFTLDTTAQTRRFFRVLLVN
jgi:hypothetical protein